MTLARNWYINPFEKAINPVCPTASLHIRPLPFTRLPWCRLLITTSIMRESLTRIPRCPYALETFEIVQMIHLLSSLPALFCGNNNKGVCLQFPFCFRPHGCFHLVVPCVLYWVVLCLPRELWVKGNIAHEVRQCQEVKCEKNACMLSTSPVYSMYHVQNTQYGSRLAVRWEGDFRVIKILRQ